MQKETTKKPHSSKKLNVSFVFGFDKVWGWPKFLQKQNFSIDAVLLASDKMLLTKKNCNKFS